MFIEHHLLAQTKLGAGDMVMNIVNTWPQSSVEEGDYPVQ